MYDDINVRLSCLQEASKIRTTSVNGNFELTKEMVLDAAKAYYAFVKGEK